MPRKNSSIPKSTELWHQFVQVRLDIFLKALDILYIKDDMKENEDIISKALYPKIVKTCFEHKDKPEPPAWDAKKGAVVDEEIVLESVVKRPDFTFALVDQTAEKVEMYTIYLNIECKCIGNNRSSSWNLNMNYINNGINRFDCLTHEYGKRTKDGIMIGYIISSNKADIQKEINSELPKNIEKLNFVSKDKVEKISTKFIRENVEPFDFKMHHIWVDFTK